MNEDFIEILGWIAASVGIVMYMPQVLKVLKLKDASSLSKPTFSVIIFGTAMWTIFGMLTSSEQAWAMNGTILGLMSVLVWYLFADNKPLRYAILAINWTVLLCTFAFMILSWTGDEQSVSDLVAYFFVIPAGAATGFGYTPQMIRTLKTRDFGSLSLQSMFLIGVLNMLWSIYWAGEASNASGDFEVQCWISTFYSVAGFVIQIPLNVAFINHLRKGGDQGPKPVANETD